MKKIIINTKKFYLMVIFTFLAINAYAESNFDFFFKGKDRYKDTIVEQVLSADTIQLESGEIIKLIGLNAPLTPRKKEKIERDQYGFVIEKPANPVIPIEQQALEFAVKLFEGKHIRLEFDNEKKDTDHKTLAYVFLIKDDIFANAEILRQGYAHLQIRPPNSKYDKQLKEAYNEAAKEKRGLQGE